MTLSQKLKAYERAFDVLNKAFFESALSKPIITANPTPGAYGHFTTWKSWKDDQGEHYEINLNPEHIDRPIEEVVATLVHEMVHLYCHEKGIQDTSRSGNYHNKKFKAEAEKRHLSVTYSRKYGWAHTKPEQKLIDFANTKRFDACRKELHRKPEGNPKIGGSSRATSSTRKYECPCCGMSVRATRNVNIACLDCDEQMVLA